MASARFLLAIDQGTTSSRAIVFDAAGAARGQAQREFRQIFPRPGWVEHDPEEIWGTTLETCRGALAAAGAGARDLAAVGISNQRETTLLWERSTGKPVHHALVWQDRRTADWCEAQRAAGLEPLVQQRTGLLLDPYFSASKLAWLLDHVAGARAAAERGELAFGTVDSFLLWRLTGGRVHATDASNAARTLLFDLHRQQWDEELLARWRIPAALLPEVRDSAGDFGETLAEHLGAAVPISGVLGDQQAALFGQGCFLPGMIKSTYGTGCFVLLNTGGNAPVSRSRLLTTVAYRLKGRTTYALEGSIFNAGTAIQWLRDQLRLLRSAPEAAALAAAADPAKRVYLVPAFTGLGAPYWDPHARGALLGLTRDSGAAEIVRAALEAVGHQTRDLLEAMAADGAPRPQVLRVDGGMSANDWAMQFLADILDARVERPRVTETTALGAACAAGLHAGLFPALETIASLWQRDASFTPAMPRAEREERYAGWTRAVRQVRCP
ncbi:MAG: glycerol kinase [Planctomycetota bacterium]|nr:MAG: glycerol kinase [Planctomycetota bacterium]